MALPSLPPDPRRGLVCCFFPPLSLSPHLFFSLLQELWGQRQDGFLSCYLPRLLDHFGPVGPWAKLLKTAVVNPWSKPRWAEKKDGLSRIGVISSLESSVGCCQVPSQPSGTVSFLPLGLFGFFVVVMFCFCFCFLFFNQAFSGN